MLHPEFELATSDMLIQFAQKSLGVASVVKDFAEPKIREGTLFQLKFKEKIPKRQFCLVTDQTSAAVGSRRSDAWDAGK